MVKILPDNTEVELKEFDAAGPDSNFHLNSTRYFYRFKVKSTPYWSSWQLLSERAGAKLKNQLDSFGDVFELFLYWQEQRDSEI